MKHVHSVLQSVFSSVVTTIAKAMKSLVPLLATLGLVGVVSSMGAAQALGNKPTAPASVRYIVKFKAPQTDKGIAVLETDAKAQSVSVKPEIQINPQMGAYTFSAPQKSQLDAYLKSLEKNPGVEYIEIDGVMKTQ